MVEKDSNLVSAIDIGTNTVLLLIAEKSDGKLKTLREAQRIPRLGRGVDRDKKLHPDSISRVIDALKEYKAIISSEANKSGIDEGRVKVTVTATSAVRDAANRDEFVDAVCRDTGWRIRLLSGPEEAEMTFRGALEMLPEQIKINHDSAIVLDIGGGSTEAASGRLSKGAIPEVFHSVDAGCVRFTERFFSEENLSEKGIPTMESVNACKSAIRKLFDETGFANRITRGINTDKAILTGVAGTVTTLAYLEAGLNKYEPERLNGMNISRVVLSKWIHYASTNSAKKMTDAYPVVMKGRADIVLSGLLILEAFMEMTGMATCVVSTGGIRHGAAMM